LDIAQPQVGQAICQLQNRVLAGFSAPVFRRAADDGVPVLAVRLGEREGVVPLRGLQQRLAIADDSPDGIMLGHIGAALDFVSELRPGDPLPAEILTGDASWTPDAGHRHIAARRLRGRLILWLRATGVKGADGIEAADFDRTDLDAGLRERIHAAFAEVARQSRLADALDAIAALESLVTDLAYIEALRERLLLKLRHMARKLDLIGAARRGDGWNADMLTQVRRLSQTALMRIGARFSAVDALSDDIIAALGGGPCQQTIIRAGRDWLYRTQRVFAPILDEWDAAPADIDAQFWNRLGRTHRLLAPRFMDTQEWHRARRVGAA
jgi:hypothetical protein